MNRRAPARSAREVHGQHETSAQEITDGCTEVHAPKVHAPDPLFRGGGHLEDWEERLRLAVEKTLGDKAARKAERVEFARRRAYGHIQRHAVKLAEAKRIKASTTQPEEN